MDSPDWPKRAGASPPHPRTLSPKALVLASLVIMSLPAVAVYYTPQKRDTYALSPAHRVREQFTDETGGVSLVYAPPFTRGGQMGGESFDHPPAAWRPNFWEQLESGVPPTLHTIHDQPSIPPLCPPKPVAEGRRRPTADESAAEWNHYGGAKVWNFSPYY